MNTKDQEKIYKLYEGSFRNIQSTQPSDNLGIIQHPNSPPHLSTGIWKGMYDPSKSKQTYTPRSEQEENESRFKYRDGQGNTFTLVSVERGIARLAHTRTGKIIEIPLDELKNLKEI